MQRIPHLDVLMAVAIAHSTGSGILPSAKSISVQREARGGPRTEATLSLSGVPGCDGRPELRCLRNRRRIAPDTRLIVETYVKNATPAIFSHHAAMAIEKSVCTLEIVPPKCTLLQIELGAMGILNGTRCSVGPRENLPPSKEETSTWTAKVVSRRVDNIIRMMSRTAAGSLLVLRRGGYVLEEYDGQLDGQPHRLYRPVDHRRLILAELMDRECLELVVGAACASIEDADRYVRRLREAAPKENPDKYFHISSSADWQCPGCGVVMALCGYAERLHESGITRSIASFKGKGDTGDFHLYRWLDPADGVERQA